MWCAGGGGEGNRGECQEEGKKAQKVNVVFMLNFQFLLPRCLRMAAEVQEKRNIKNVATRGSADDEHMDQSELAKMYKLT